MTPLESKKAKKGRKVSSRHAADLILTAGDWGFFDKTDPDFFTREFNKPSSFEFSITTGGKSGTPYLSLPFELNDELPFLNTKELFKNRQVTEIPYINPARGINKMMPIARTPVNGRATVLVEGLMYFHPALLEPQGEVFSVARHMLNMHKETDGKAAGLLTAFENLCTWLYTPELLKGQLTLPPWFELPADESSGCPVQLTTLSARLHYLQGMAENRIADHLAYKPMARDGGTDIRSSKLNDYDKFAIWYAAKKEIYQFTPAISLSDKQFREYVSYRWLPWRRPESLRPHIPTLKFLRDDLDYDATRPIVPPRLPPGADLRSFIAEQVQQGYLDPTPL
jgi:hypothetical protein